LLEAFISPDFSCSLGFGLPCLQLSVESVVLLVDLTLEFFVDLKLGNLVLIKNLLEIFGATSIPELILVVGQLVSFNSLILLGDVLACSLVLSI